jgi:copper chaperone
VKIDLFIPAMSCENCVRNIEANVGAIEGVTTVKADLATKRVSVSFDAAKVTTRQIEAALRQLGFAVER